MAARRRFRESVDSEAVSPVIAVILMVAITVVLAATVFVLTSEVQSDDQRPPTVNINLEGRSDVSQIWLDHLSGETLAAGEYYISIQAAGSPHDWTLCQGDLAAGGRIAAETTSTGSICSGYSLNGGPTTLGPGSWRVGLRWQTISVFLDETVEIT